MKPNARAGNNGGPRDPHAIIRCAHTLVVALVACATPVSGPRSVRAVERRSARVSRARWRWEGAAIGASSAGRGGAIGNYLDKQAQELQAVTNARRTENGILVDLKSSSCSAPTARSSSPPRWSRSRKSARHPRQIPDDRIRIEGHTDSTGSAAYNEQLSLASRVGVRDVLASRGVNPRQMLVEGAERRGPSGHSTPQGRAETDASSSTSTFRSARERPQPVVVFAPSFRTQSCLDASQQRFLVKVEQVIHRAALQARNRSSSSPCAVMKMIRTSAWLATRWRCNSSRPFPACAHRGSGSPSRATIGAQELLGRSKYFHHELDGPEQGRRDSRTASSSSTTEMRGIFAIWKLSPSPSIDRRSARRSITPWYRGTVRGPYGFLSRRIPAPRHPDRSASDPARILCITLSRWTFTVISLVASSVATCLLSSSETTCSSLPLTPRQRRVGGRPWRHLSPSRAAPRAIAPSGRRAVTSYRASAQASSLSAPGAWPGAGFRPLERPAISARSVGPGSGSRRRSNRLLVRATEPRRSRR